jgi:chromosome segregation ATPase
MIEQMHIKNFQSHEDTVLGLAPGVNAIVGNSHVGKSAIRRVLNWVNCNRPLGDSYIKTGAKEAYARIAFDDGVVERFKSKKKNEYRLDSNPEPYTAFGSSVPEDVTDLVRMSDVNVQTQHGPFFLVFDSPGAVATYLRSVTGLDELSEVAADITSRLRGAKASLSSEEVELEDLQGRVEELEQIDVNRLEEAIEEYEHCEERNETLRKDVRTLSRLIDRVEELESQATVSEEKFQMLSDEMDRLVEDGERLREEHRALSSALSWWDVLDTEVVEVREDLLSDVEEIIATYQENVEDDIVLDQKIKRAAEMVRDALRDDEALKDLQAEEHQLLCQIKTCPACGLELTEDAKAHLIGEEI